MSDSEDLWLARFKSKLTEINDDYEYNVEWFTNIQKNQSETGDEPTDSNNVYVVLEKLPSTSYGDTNLTIQYRISLLCYQQDIPVFFDLFQKYQNSVVNTKYSLGSGTTAVTVTENWYGPQLEQNFIEMRTGNGALISMSGSVSFSVGAVDIAKLYLYNVDDDDDPQHFLFLQETTTADTVPTPFINSPEQRANNRSVIYKLDLKVVNTNSDFCTQCRLWKYHSGSINIEIPVRIIYTDNYDTGSKSMLITNVTFQTSDGTLPSISVSLMERAS